LLPAPAAWIVGTQANRSAKKSSDFDNLNLRKATRENPNTPPRRVYAPDTCCAAIAAFFSTFAGQAWRDK
jgi:hypothetical protein